MFHEVRIFDADGTLKKVIPTKRLSKLYWKNFEKAQESIGLTKSGGKTAVFWDDKFFNSPFQEISDYGI